MSRNVANNSCLTQITSDNQPLSLSTKIKLPALKSKLNKSLQLSPTDYVRCASKLDQVNTAADYKLPVNYPKYFEQNTSFTLPKDGSRHSYMGNILSHAYQTIRPGAYNPEDPGGIKISPREIRFAYKKAARETFLDEIRKTKRWLPSP